MQHTVTINIPEVFEPKITKDKRFRSLRQHNYD